MRRAVSRLLLATLLAVAGSPLQAAKKKPQQVQDLHYGEVLFHFYSEDYFTAITHLMAARERGQLPHHADEAELLLGGLQLSYGMHREAEKQFQGILDTQADRDTRNRVWYYLTKIAYQRGLYEDAREALARIDKPRDKQLRAELAVMDANIRMALGENAEAAEALKKARAPEGWREYLRINRGIALLRAGDIEQGRATLDKLGKADAGSEELRALRDRANLGLGYQLLKAGKADQARTYLERVRLGGPFMQAALLGAGWADAESGDYQRALTPWLALLDQTSYDPPVQEAHLAVPYAFARLGEQQRAIHFYEQAIGYFDAQQQEIEQAIASVRSGLMLQLLAQADTGISGGWLHANPTLEGVPAGRYLVDVLAGHDFQESLKDYRDLGYLEKLLQERLASIDLFHDMVDTRRLAYEKNAPRIRARLEQNEAAALQDTWNRYRERLQAARRSGDPMALATLKEQQQWERLQQVQATLETLPANARLDRIRDKARWLQGVLYWQIQADQRQRLWDIDKRLQALETGIDEARRRHARLLGALDEVRAGFDGYDSRIEALRQRILDLLPAIRQARTGTSEHLQRLALQELEVRKQRLVSYRSQARYALARNYDLLARQQPEAAP
ncbi:MAG TPA: tetratricopeptide repeat protein [Gammaproteobacteria bacterium]|nr:tetratricopeptide repeat protein [Gammaproteobacteria bacterium]